VKDSYRRIRTLLSQGDHIQVTCSWATLEGESVASALLKELLFRSSPITDDFSVYKVGGGKVCLLTKEIVKDVVGVAAIVVVLIVICISLHDNRLLAGNVTIGVGDDDNVLVVLASCPAVASKAGQREK
jgi:hypothetical protein